MGRMQSRGSNGRNRNHSRVTEQQFFDESELSAEEKAAAEESLSIYCKPVELYNILQQRQTRNPLFLQRCLHYKIQAKRQKRIKMVITFSGFISNEKQGQNIWPLYVLVSTPIPNSLVSSNIYCYSKPRVLKSSRPAGPDEQLAVSFILPEIKKLPEKVRNESLTILFVSCVERTAVSNGRSLDSCLFGNYNGRVLWGKLSMHSLCSAWERSIHFNCGHQDNVISAVDMHHGILEHNFLDDGSHNLAFQLPSDLNRSDTIRFQVAISAQELGPRERSPYDSFPINDGPSSLTTRIVRLRAGNVIFNYKYYNNRLQKTEVTEDFTCPFCLIRCSSYRGLEGHLKACHDLFQFEFLVTKEFQTVNVEVKNAIWKSEGSIDDLDDGEARFRPFSFSFKPRKRQRAVDSSLHELGQAENGDNSAGNGLLKEQSQNIKSCQFANGTISETCNSGEEPRICDAKNVLVEEKMLSQHDDTLDLVSKEKEKEMEVTMEKVEEDESSLHTELQGGCVANVLSLATETSVQTGEASVHTDASGLMPPTTLRFGKTRKLSVERTEPRSRMLLQKRQFFHSHRAQPMALEQVFSDRDSEDEVDDDIADFEDRRMLDDFVDVTKHEKQIMHLWNSFVRKQRVIADGHISWACEAFSKLHGQDLGKNKPLQWCWRFVMIKLWNHNLLDAATMNRCNIILENYSKNQ